MATWFIFPCLNFNTHNFINLKISCITSSGHCPVLAVWFSKNDTSFPSLTSTLDRMNPCRGSLTHPMLVKESRPLLDSEHAVIIHIDPPV